MARSGVLIVFTRKPVAGKTKTRLIPVLGKEGAARLHRKLLVHTLDVASRSAFTSCEMHVCPETENVFLQQLSRQFAANIHAQTGNNLGERMYNAVSGALQRHNFVVITGCDIPLLDLSVLDHAHDILLQQQADAVLGPAEDGGYYLIGVNWAEPSLFQGIPWGTGETARHTRARLAECGRGWEEITMLWDVDTPADLEKLKNCHGFDDEWSKTAADFHIADSG